MKQPFRAVQSLATTNTLKGYNINASMREHNYLLLMAKLTKSIDKSDTRLIDVTLEELQQLIEHTVQTCLNSSLPKEQPTDIDELLTIEEAAKFLSLAKSTLYGLTANGKLPFMKRSKRLYFSKSELMEYLKAGRTKGLKELDQEAEEYLSNNYKKGGYHE